MFSDISMCQKLHLSLKGDFSIKDSRVHFCYLCSLTKTRKIDDLWQTNPSYVGTNTMALSAIYIHVR